MTDARPGRLRAARLFCRANRRSPSETDGAYFWCVTIIMERFHWIDNATYFRSDYGTTHFCRVAPLDDGRWEIMFTRGANPPGPHYAASFLQAKRWVVRFAMRREKQLIGPPTQWCPPSPFVPSYGDAFDIMRLPAEVRPIRHGAPVARSP